MRRYRRPHWIRHTHLFDADEFECSACGARLSDTSNQCPVCGANMQGMTDPQDWVDEAEELDWILGDDD